jgi:hypothetical protein
VSEDLVPLEGGEQKWEVVRVGAEPVVLWGEDEDGSPRWSVAAPGWRFERTEVLELHEGALISATPTIDVEDFDLEHGELFIAGFTLADLREIAVRRESWWRRLRRRVRR